MGEEPCASHKERDSRDELPSPLQTPKIFALGNIGLLCQAVGMYIKRHRYKKQIDKCKIQEEEKRTETKTTIFCIAVLPSRRGLMTCAEWEWLAKKVKGDGRK